MHPRLNLESVLSVDFDALKAGRRRLDEAVGGVIPVGDHAVEGEDGSEPVYFVLAEDDARVVGQGDDVFHRGGFRGVGEGGHVELEV